VKNVSYAIPRWTSGSIIKTGTEKIMTFEIFSFCAETVTIRFMVKRKRGEKDNDY